MYNWISAIELRKMIIRQENFVLLDVRDEEEYITGHIPGSFLLPFNILLYTAQQVIPDKQIPIVVYCKKGIRSKGAVEELGMLGYKNVYLFGSIRNWPFGLVR